MKTEYQYIRFALWPVQPSVKTQTWDCRNIRHGTQLGVVKWDGAWRQYVFEPSRRGVIFSAGCLADIQHFIRQLREERKQCPSS